MSTPDPDSGWTRMPWSFRTITWTANLFIRAIAAVLMVLWHLARYLERFRWWRWLRGPAHWELRERRNQDSTWTPFWMRTMYCFGGDWFHENGMDHVRSIRCEGKHVPPAAPLATDPSTQVNQ